MLTHTIRPAVGRTKKKGLGKWANDRPPVYGTVGRDSGQIRLEVLGNTTQEQVEWCLTMHRSDEGVCYTDESGAYGRIGTEARAHHTVCHRAKEWARDEDGDGVNEVHTNTAEGLWRELRNFLRRFKGVSKHFLHLYVAMFEWMHNLKKVNAIFIRAMAFSQKGT